ncbi:unnamed protein product [Lampetra planeri]
MAAPVTERERDGAARGAAGLASHCCFAAIGNGATEPRGEDTIVAAGAGGGGPGMRATRWARHFERLVGARFPPKRRSRHFGGGSGRCSRQNAAPAAEMPLPPTSTPAEGEFQPSARAREVDGFARAGRVHHERFFGPSQCSTLPPSTIHSLPGES